MSFFKRIFGSRKTPEQKAEEFLLSYSFNDPVQITSLPESPVDGETLKQVMEKLVSEKKIAGRFVGKKGWFIPGDPTPIFEQILKQIEHEPITVDELSKTLKLSKKRSVLALKDELRRKQRINDYVFGEDEVYSLKYLRQTWEGVLSGKDFVEDEIFYEDILGELPHREIFEGILDKWLTDEKSAVVRLGNGRLMLRDLVPEMVVEHVKRQWEGGAKQIMFDEIANEFGLPEDQVTKIILDLVNSNELEDVTVYTTDRMIKRRSSF